MKVLLVGVGGVGEAIAAIAKPRAWLEQIVLADYNLERAKEVQKKIGDDQRFPVEFIDASKQENIEELAKKYGVDLIMNAVDPIFNKQIFDAAYNVGVKYMDMAMTLSEPNRDDPFHKTGIKLGDYQFEKSKEWEQKGLLALVGIGVEPGMADVFARYAQDHLFDVIDGDTILGDPSTPDYTVNNAGDTVEYEWYTRKVWVPGNDVPTQWGHHRRLIRYADVLLMAAEALNENNKPGEALVYLNMVRARARQGNGSVLPDITTTNQEELRNLILTERRHELAMEGWRFWDLIRTGKAAQVLGPLGFEPGKNEVLPIPQNEIDISQGALIQNPKY